MASTGSQLIMLPFLGNRRYVHSTTIIKWLVDYHPDLDGIIIKFRQLATSNHYMYVEGESKKTEAPVFGHAVLSNGVTLSFNFIPVNTPNTVSVSDDGIVDIFRVTSKYELVDALVLHSKTLCDGLYDSSIDQLYMLKIELGGISRLDWPPKLSWTQKVVGSRITVKYFSDELQVGEFTGLIRSKN